MKKRSITLLVLILIFNAKHNYAQDYGQVYVYMTTNFSSDGSLQSSYLPLMGVATEDTSVVPPAVTAYTACTVCPYYKLKSGELGNASIDIGTAGLDNGAMTLIASGSGSDLSTVIENLGVVSASGAGQILFVFPKGSDMQTPTSSHDGFNASYTGGVTAVTNSDGYWWGVEATRMHSITLDSPHLGYSEWYVIGRTTWIAIDAKIKLRLLDATDASAMPANDLPKITISELMYNSSGTDDEWIEIYNGSGSDVDISNWTIGMNASGNSEYSGDIFTFPNSTTITAGEYITLALGSNGDGVFNNDNPFTPDYNNLSVPDFLVAHTNNTDNLANDGGFIVLRPDDFDTVSIVHYDHTRSGTNGSGYTYENKAPDFNNQVSTSDTGTWQSSFITGGSPKIEAAEIWNSSLGTSDNLTILDKENIFVAAQDGNINDITINSGGFLSILRNSSSSLTVANNFTNNGTVTLNSDADEFASIIVGGSSTGDIIYNRYTNTVGTGEWDLIGSPVEGLSISSFVSTNSTPLATSGSIYAVGTYDNSDDTWTNYTSSSVGAAGNFDIGKGHQMATSSGATMAFTGTIATTNQTQSIINNDGNGNGGRRWNLVANPFPSYLNANNNADGTNNFLKVNLDSGVIDASFSAIYGWDADGSGYTIYNHASAATYIAPGQAFFVAAASSSAANLSFTEAMQTTTGGDDFITSSVTELNSEFYLKLYEGENFIANTRFYFDSNLTLGLDPGYDAGAYDQSMALLSRLVENDQGVGMGINAMSTESFEQTIIPLVVNRTAGTAFRISLEGITIPEDVQLFLEDTQAQTYTNLRTEDFILTPENELNGMGRFYLRIGNSSLGVEDTEESYVRVYKPNTSDYITIEGLVNVQKTKIRLYNLIGQEILNKTLSSNQTNYRISTQGIPHGVYVIKLQFERSQITKKLIIN